MSTTMEKIRDWHKLGQREGKRYMVIVADTFSYEDYPIFTDAPNFEVQRLRGKSMTKVMEVYDLSKPFPETRKLVMDLPAMDPVIEPVKPEPGSKVDLAQAIAVQLVDGFVHGVDGDDRATAIDSIAAALSARPESIDALVGTNIMPHGLLEAWEDEDAGL